MNNDLLEALKDLNDYILSLDLIKEYKYYEKQISLNTELKEIEEQLKQMQKDIVNKKHQGEDCTLLIKKYTELKEYYISHPYINNYLNLKEEVNELLQTIKNDINKQLELNLKNSK